MNKLFKLGFVFLSLILGFAACKPKQSSYQSAYEAAKEREIEENTKQTTNVNKQPTYPVYNSNYDNEKVRQEKITAVYESDAAGLKGYNVVIASLAVKPSAEALKARMEKDGYNVILAQNQDGLYRVIIASSDDKSQAVSRRNEIARAYQSKGSTDYLRRTYGIPFDDLWILQRSY